MPHLSRHKLSKQQIQEIEGRVMLFLSSPSMKTRQVIFRELFTNTEQLMIAKRLAMLFFIAENAPTHDISSRLCVSPSTVARFENAFDKGSFAQTFKWLKRNKEVHKALHYIADLVSVPFEAQRKSLARFVDETL